MVGVVVLDVMDEVGDVECPEEGGMTDTFGDTYVDLNVSIIVGGVVEDAVHEGEVDHVDALPEVRGDVILM
jgi:hypothetical protein